MSRFFQTLRKFLAVFQLKYVQIDSKDIACEKLHH